MSTSEIVPKITDPEWHEYVMSQFTQEEVRDDKPLVTGLRRIAEKLLGQIIESISRVRDYPRPENNYRAVVEHRLVFKHNGYNLKYSSAADVGPDNTAEPFCNFPVATAGTIAEGRALKMALKLRGQLYEELLPTNNQVGNSVETGINIDDIVGSDIFTTSQRLAVNRVAKQIDVNPVLVFGGVPQTSEDGSVLIEKLNLLRANMDTAGIPEEFKPFVKLEG